MTANNYRSSLKQFSLSIALGTLLVPSVPLQLQAQPSFLTPTSSQSWEISQAFSPPNRSAPPSAAGGGARSDCVLSNDRDGRPLTALIPGNSLALTVNPRPTFYVYMPQTRAKTAEFLIKDEEDNDVYRTTLPVPQNAGIMGIQLPENGSKTLLESGKNYHWFVALVCKPQDRREDVFVDGWVQRTEPSATLTNELQNAKPEDRAGIYAKAGIWYEAVNALAELRSSRPNDPTTKANWEALLKSVKLDAIADKPLVR